MVDRSDLDIDRLEAAERAVRIRQAFVGVHDRRTAEHLCCDVGTHHVDAIERGPVVDWLAPAFDDKIGIGDGDVEVLGHLVMINDLADGDADGIATAHLLGRRTRAWILRCFSSVATKSSRRLRASSSASNGLRQTTSRSPG